MERTISEEQSKILWLGIDIYHASEREYFSVVTIQDGDELWKCP